MAADKERFLAWLREQTGGVLGAGVEKPQPVYPVADKVWELAKAATQQFRPPTVEAARQMDNNSLGMFDIPGGGSLASAPLAKKAASVSPITKLAQKMGLELEQVPLGQADDWVPAWKANRIQHVPGDVFPAEHELAHAIMTPKGKTLEEYSKQIEPTSHLITDQIEQQLGKKLGIDIEPGVTSLNNLAMDHIPTRAEFEQFVLPKLPPGTRNPYLDLKSSNPQAELDKILQYLKPNYEDVLKRVDRGVSFDKTGRVVDDLGSITTSAKKTALKRIKKSGPELLDWIELEKRGITPGMQHIGPDDAESLGIPWQEQDFNYRMGDSIPEKRYLVKDGQVIGHVGMDDSGSIKAAYINNELQGEGLGTEMYRQLFNNEGFVNSDELSAMEPGAKAIWEKLSKEYKGQVSKGRKNYEFDSSKKRK